MAGHSHWAKVRHQKGVTDARKGKLFSKLVREIALAAKLGGGDPGFNPRLRRAVETAKAEGVSSESITRAIQRGTGEVAGEAYEEILYEGYAPGGVAVLVEAATDNRNRTAAEVRSLFTRHGGNLAGAGSVSWLFQRKGIIRVDSTKASFDRVFEVALEASADDVQASDGSIEILSPPERFEGIVKSLETAKIPIESATLGYVPQNLVSIKDEESARALLRLLDSLEEHEDVQHVFANFEMSPEILAQVEAAASVPGR
ncbi:putative transcriptional regulatory protein [Methylacidimicrobium cyclopophantes]|uniref:Probable transcriptional regulatory protein MAMC_02083 n=1 Tax=Methylacidimicrobium cyclopophantes TaxID=1041766 RepID=A0A5E6MGF2_9BACT|nr:YebC/PmpR family DNA-binding transcriptional regulator [Methylacidimicrobium cyclopophantes]VVM08371.1 putative transcriptional regulatory protein [Methylacidimicrobium cyclopophantes]